MQPTLSEGLMLRGSGLVLPIRLSDGEKEWCTKDEIEWVEHFTILHSGNGSSMTTKDEEKYKTMWLEYHFETLVKYRNSTCYEVMHWDLDDMREKISYYGRDLFYWINFFRLKHL
jgi:hypothetical protein